MEANTEREVLEKLDDVMVTYFYAKTPFDCGSVLIKNIDHILILISGDKQLIKEFWMKHYDLTPEMYQRNLEAIANNKRCKGRTIRLDTRCNLPIQGSLKGLLPYYELNDFYCKKHAY